MPSLKLSVEAQIEKPSSINFVAQPITPRAKHPTSPCRKLQTCVDWHFHWPSTKKRSSIGPRTLSGPQK
jgi:hypothetical protein